MPEILFDFPVAAAPARLFEAISRPEGLDQWWTEYASGSPMLGSEYVLRFGPDHEWRATVTELNVPRLFELTMTIADADWTNSRVGFMVSERDGGSYLRFYHVGWPEVNDHFRISGFCWAMYLRILRRYLEHGEIVPYDERLDR